jgi:predicted permease
MRERFQLPASRTRQARDLDDEFELHLSLRAEALQRAGYAPEAARQEAERQFGDVSRVRSECRVIDDANRAAGSRRLVLEELGQDLRLAARSLRRDRSFAVVTLLLIALGIGATTAIFSLVNGVMLRPLPGAHPERAMWISVADSDGGEGVSPALAFAWQDQARAFDQLATLRATSVTATGIGEPLRLDGLRVGPGFLEVMGVHASPGRDLVGGDHMAGHAPVVVLSHALWQERFGGAASAIGASITLDGVAHTIVGVLPVPLHGVGGTPAFLLPDVLPDGWRENFTPFLEVVGRLRADVPPARARVELQGLLDARLRASGRVLEGDRVQVTPLADHLTAPFRARIYLLFAAVACVLAIAWVNVTSLLLARGAGRSREVAVRTSLGASRARLVRQLLTEHAVLALAGGVAGLVMAAWLVGALVRLLPGDLPRLADVSLDATSLAFGATLTGATVLLAGVFPAVRAARVEPNAVLQDGGRGASSGAASDRVRRAFVILEVALSVVMLMAAGLLLRSAAALGGVAPGFAADDVLTARYALTSREYPEPAQVLAAHARIVDALRASGRVDVALASSIPLGAGGGGSDFHLVGGAGANVEANAALRFVSPGYLRTMGISLVSGRDFTPADDAQAPRRIIVSEQLATLLGIQGPAVGREVAGTSSPFRDAQGAPVPWEIVGVVREPRDAGLRETPRPQVFIPLAQTPAEVFDWSARAVHVTLRSDGSRAQAVSRIRAAVHQVNPALAVYDVMTMRERLGASMALERANTILLAGLGFAALVLAVSGLYGVVSHAVRQREREFGVRMALGADRAAIVRLVVRWGGLLTIVGLLVGAPLAMAGGNALRSLLFGVNAFDPLTLLATIVTLLVASAASCLIPAWRASRIPPDTALRA